MIAMDERRGLFMEFLVLAGLVIGMVAALVTLTVLGYSETEVASTIGHLIETGFGAVIALAYAARGLGRESRIEPGTTATTVTAVTRTPENS